MRKINWLYAYAVIITIIKIIVFPTLFVLAIAISVAYPVFLLGVMCIVATALLIYVIVIDSKITYHKLLRKKREKNEN